MSDRMFGDGGVGARSPPRERIWERREVGEDDRRYLQAQRFPGSSEAERFRASGSSERREHDRRRDDEDRDRRLWNHLSNEQFGERGLTESQWNQPLVKKLSNGTIPNSNLNNLQLKSGCNTLHLNPNVLFRNADANSNPSSGFLNVGRGYAADPHGIGVSIEHRSQESLGLGMAGLPNHISMDNDMARSHSSYQTIHGGTKSYGNAGSNSGNPSMGLGHYTKDNHLHFDNGTLHHHTEEKPRYYSGHTATYGTPVSRFTNMPLNNSRDESYDVHEGGLSVPCNGVGRSSGMVTEPIGHNGYSHIHRSDQKRTLLNPMEEMDRPYTYPEVQGNDIGMSSSGLYDKIKSGREDCGYQEFPRVSYVDPIVDRIDGVQSPFGGGSRESMLLHRYKNLQEQREYTDESVLSYDVDQDGGILGSEIPHIEYETEAHMKNESLREYYDSKRDSDARFYEDRLVVPDEDQDIYDTEGIPHEMLMPKELSMQDISRNRLTRKHDESKKTSIHEQNVKPYHIWGASHNEFHGHSYGDEPWADGINDQSLYDDDMDHMVSSLNAPTTMQGPSFRYKSTGRNVKNRLEPPGRDVKNRLGAPGRDITKRLGPARRDIKKRLGPVGRDTKKHLGHAGECDKKHPSRNAHIQLPCPKKHTKQKCQKRNIDHSHGSDTVPLADSSKVEGKHGKSYPSEDSDEFQLLVHDAFLKFVKLLNENSAHRRRYIEQGGTGILKCGICGSNSKEYVNTKRLARHALTFQSAGSRAEHMGFHNALCALMGWNRGVALDSQWTPNSLTDAEAMALKEDLIIWPPTVVIHNSSIANKIPAERLIISIKDLEAVLRGNGFDTEKTKICRGKPANQSIMVVNFPGTLSGLQEAERLHKFYAEKMHGRAELELKCNNDETKTEKSSAERMEDVLFGYLGVAGDLDKLDFESKKHCLVKSKKEIQLNDKE